MAGQLRVRQWIIVGILALLWHLMIFTLPWNQWLSGIQAPSPPRIELNSIPPAQLEKIRKQWRQEKGLAISQADVPAVQNAPKDAQYISDQNRAVEKEQRATKHAMLPKPGSAAKSPAKRSGFKTLPSLSHLGVPLNRTWTEPKPFERDHSEKDEQKESDDERADQFIADQRLPEGDRNLLNTEQSTYYSFYSRMYQSLSNQMTETRELPERVQIAPGEYTSQVEAVLDSAGYVQEIRFIRGSGVPEFDSSIERVWRKAGRFPNPPAGLTGKDGKVRTMWTFYMWIDSTSEARYRSPSRSR